MSRTMRTSQRVARSRHVAIPTANLGTGLQVATGYSSLAGPREANEDFCGMVTPTGAELGTKGVVAAIADGVSGSRGGR